MFIHFALAHSQRRSGRYAYRKLFWKTLKNTQILILNPKKYQNCNFEGLFESYFGKNGFHFPKIFQKTLKNTKIRILYRRAYLSLYFGSAPRPPPPGGQYKNHYEQCIKTLKEKRGIPCYQQIREILSVYHTMTHRPHESVADFTH